MSNKTDVEHISPVAEVPEEPMGMLGESEEAANAAFDVINEKLDLLLQAVGITYIKEEKHES